MIQLDRADDTEVRETYVVDHRIDGALTDDRVQRRRSRGPIGEINLVKLTREIRGSGSGEANRVIPAGGQPVGHRPSDSFGRTGDQHPS